MLKKGLVYAMTVTFILLTLTACNQPGKENEPISVNPTEDQENAVKQDQDSQPSPASDPVLHVVQTYELADGSQLLFKMDELGGFSELTLQSDGEEKVVGDKKPSEPAVSPDREKFAFIDVMQWEYIGEVYLYDIETGENQRILARDEDFDNQHKPKALAWLDDRRLLVTIGYAYGTVSMGGDLYAYDIRSDNLTRVVETGEPEDIMDVSVEGDQVILDMAHYNDDKTGYDVKQVTYPKREILQLTGN
ncbi:MAG: DUF4652 domain-containing protein [Bacillaceae bacterium]|nr:DUF4652 domain-containing protein [Bacillaceae bacterium]